ncbi:MAG: flagellar export protein FliJ [Bacillota bacterium]
MNKFKFRLQTPYDVVIWREKLAKQELRERQMAYDQEEDRLHEKLAGMKSLLDKERSLRGQNVSINKMVVIKELQNMSQTLVRLQREAVDQALARLEESRQELTEVTREKKSMEKLKERRYAKFLYEYQCQEQTAIDEVAVNSFWRKQKGNGRINNFSQDKGSTDLWERL